MIITSFQPLFIPILKQLGDIPIVSASSRFLDMLKGVSIEATALPDTSARSYGIAARIITDRKSTRLNSSHIPLSRMPSSA